MGMTNHLPLLCWEDVQDDDGILEERKLMHFIDKLTEQGDDIDNFLAWFAREYKGDK